MPVTQLLMSSLSGGGNSNQGAGQGLSNIASGIFSGIVGLSQKRKARNALANLHRPEYEIPNEVLQNQKMAQMAAAQGLPSEQYNQAMQSIQRQQNRGLAAATSRRGALMALPGIQQQANDALLNLNVKNAQARMANRQQLYGINNQVAGYRDKAFQINKMQPYQQDYNYNMDLLGMGNQNFYSGIDKLLGGGGQLLNSLNPNLGNNKNKKTNYNQGYVPDNTYLDYTSIPNSPLT